MKDKDIGKGIEKNIGDWVHVFDGHIYEIKVEPNVYVSNRWATDEEIKEHKKKTKLF